MKPRVVMVLTHEIFEPHLDVRVYDEAKSLVENGFEVTVVCRVKPETKYKKVENYNGVTIVRVPSKYASPSLPRLLQVFYNRRNSRVVANKILELAPNIIHCHDLDSLREGVIAARKRGVPLVYDSHEDWPALELAKGSKLMYHLTSRYEKRLLKHVSHVVTVNKTLARKFSKHKKTTVMFNYPSKRFTKSTIKLSTLKAKLGLENKLVIMYHGIIGEKKGIIELIDTAAQLSKNHDNLKFVVIGPAYEQYLEMVRTMGIKDNFIFTGTIDYNDIASYLKVADIYYTIFRPTRQYLVSTPIKVFEAMAVGLPIITNAEFPELSKIIKKSQAGILVNCNVKEIVTGLENLINNPAKRKQMGLNARKAAAQEYVWETQVPKFVKIYQDLLSEN